MASTSPPVARVTDRFGSRAATAIIVVSAAATGSVVFFARGLTGDGMASAAVSMYRFLFSATVLLPFVRIDRAKRSAFGWALGTGVVLGLGWMAYVQALEDLDVATVGVVYMTYPLFAMTAARVLFGSRQNGRSVAGAGLVIAAATIALSPVTLGAGDVGSLIVAFGAPVAFGASIAVLTERLPPLAPFERLAGVALGAVVGLGPLVTRLPVDHMVPTSSSGWWLLIGIGLVTSLLPLMGYSMAAPVVGPARTSMAGAIELPVVLVIGWCALGEPMTIEGLAAGLLIVAAMVLTPARPPSWNLQRAVVRHRSQRSVAPGPTT